MPAIIFFILIFLSPAANAHKNSDSYLILDVEESQIHMRWDIALRDLQNVIDLDVNHNGRIEWGELKLSKSDVFAYALARLEVFSNLDKCTFRETEIKANERSDGHYIVLLAQGQCAESIQSLDIRYQLFFELDTQHRGLIKIQSRENNISFAFSPEVNFQTFALNENSGSNTFFRFFSEGVWHIWIGFDHILFLLSLLLPAVLLRYRKNWLGVENFPGAFVEVIKIVTAFTIAHSLTLCLVMLGKVSLPVMMVEAIIALSVIVAALNNLYPVITTKRWLLGFCFGLIHGFGFANVLSELELSSNALFATLLGFNIGVEIGQLAIVVIFMPVAFLLRNGWLYQNIIFKLGSISIASIGFIWFLERTL